MSMGKYFGKTSTKTKEANLVYTISMAPRLAISGNDKRLSTRTVISKIGLFFLFPLRENGIRSKGR